jgi:hypothetical protein
MVEQQVERAGAAWGKVTQHAVFGHTCDRIKNIKASAGRQGKHFTPFMRSVSAKVAASCKISTVSSKEQRMRGPESLRLKPCRLMANK